MSLTKNWYTIDEAVSKFGISGKQLQEWVEDGVLRSEGGKGEVIRLNGEDIERKLNLTPSV
jgi:predicted site-specific integrase-resolvase